MFICVFMRLFFASTEEDEIDLPEMEYLRPVSNVNDTDEDTFLIYYGKWKIEN